jgi:hypothetical protein
MDVKSEGPVIPPLPLVPRAVRLSLSQAAHLLHDGSEPRCEMCGMAVVATHCKRICLKCGFMTGCSEGV